MILSSCLSNTLSDTHEAVFSFIPLPDSTSIFVIFFPANHRYKLSGLYNFKSPRLLKTEGIPPILAELHSLAKSPHQSPTRVSSQLRDSDAVLC